MQEVWATYKASNEDTKPVSVITTSHSVPSSVSILEEHADVVWIDTVVVVDRYRIAAQCIYEHERF